jgi:hypothetical protein
VSSEQTTAAEFSSSSHLPDPQTASITANYQDDCSLSCVVIMMQFCLLINIPILFDYASSLALGFSWLDSC